MFISSKGGSEEELGYGPAKGGRVCMGDGLAGVVDAKLDVSDDAKG